MKLGARTSTSAWCNQNNMQKRLLNFARRKLFSVQTQARHQEYSILFSEDDARSRPSERLLDVALEAISRARKIDLTTISSRLNGRFPYADNLLNIWPGEHYRLLAGLVESLQPKLIIEIGTAEGLSALTMKKFLSDDGRIVTFDIVNWKDYPRPCLTDHDFADGRLHQRVADLTERQAFEQHRQLLEKADLIFIDAAKDGIQERKFIENFETIAYVGDPIVVFDDVRLWNMLAIWRELQWSKLDLTSFGHWCGTGICEPPKNALETER